MSGGWQFEVAVPVLPSLDLPRTLAFYEAVLGFARVHLDPGSYAIVDAGPVDLHFWACTDAALPRASGCRVKVRGLDALHARCVQAGCVHPNAPLAARPWGAREFGVLDPDGNLLTFFEPA